MGLEIFAIVFGLVFVSEVADKTQLVIIGLQAKYQSYINVYLGALGAFALSNGLAVVVGGLLFRAFPGIFLELLVGGLFIVAGFYIIVNEGQREEPKVNEKRIVLIAFAMIFLSEFGDKTQFTAGLLAARFGDFLLTFLGAFLAIAVITILGIFIGDRIADSRYAYYIEKVSGCLFVILGIATLLF